MLYLVVMALFLIIQNVEVMKEQNSKMEIESKLKDLFEFDDGPAADKLLIVQEDHEDDVVPEDDTSEAEDEADMEEDGPYERFRPVEKAAAAEEKNAGGSSKAIQQKIFNATKEQIERLKRRFREEQLSMSWPIIIIIIASTMLLSCCCAICLRNRIVACINLCRPRKKEKIHMEIDEEVGKKKSRFGSNKKKRNSSAKKRAKSLSAEYKLLAEESYPVEPMMPREVLETPPTGCCNCCKKKKRGKK